MRKELREKDEVLRQREANVQQLVDETRRLERSNMEALVRADLEVARLKSEVATLRSTSQSFNAP